MPISDFGLTRGGGGVWTPPFLADIICEQPLIDGIGLGANSMIIYLYYFIIGPDFYTYYFSTGPNFHSSTEKCYLEQAAILNPLLLAQGQRRISRMFWVKCTYRYI